MMAGLGTEKQATFHTLWSRCLAPKKGGIPHDVVVVLGKEKQRMFSHGVVSVLGTQNGGYSTLSGGSAGHGKRLVFHIERRRCWAPKTSHFTHGVVAVLGAEKRVVFHTG